MMPASAGLQFWIERSRVSREHRNRSRCPLEPATALRTMRSSHGLSRASLRARTSSNSGGAGGVSSTLPLLLLDVGTLNGFYAFVAEHRGAARVVAVDNEQFVAWVKARSGIEFEGGAGFRAIGKLLGSRVEYVRGDALALVDTMSASM